MCAFLSQIQCFHRQPYFQSPIPVLTYDGRHPKSWCVVRAILARSLGGQETSAKVFQQLRTISVRVGASGLQTVLWIIESITYGFDSLIRVFVERATEMSVQRCVFCKRRPMWIRRVMAVGVGFRGARVYAILTRMDVCWWRMRRRESWRGRQ